MNLFCGRVGCKDGRKFTVQEVTMVKGSIKFKVEYVGGGAATFGKRELLKMMPVHLMQQLAESQIQQHAHAQQLR